MSDNVGISTGSDATIASDDIGGVQYQRVKIAQGADGAATDVSTAAPLQVSLANTASNATAVKVDGSAATQPISGTVTANAGTGTLAVSMASNTPTLQSGSTTAVTQGTATSLKAQAENYQGGSAVSSSNPLEVNLRTSTIAVPVTDNSGSLTVDYATTGSGTATGALRVELPTNGTGTVGLNAGTNAIGGITLNGNSNAALKDDTGFGENITSGIASVHPRLWDGAAYDRWAGNSTDGALVNLGANNDVTVTNATASSLKAEVTGATAGSGTATGAIRVELPTNGTGVVGLNAGTNAIGKLTANSGVDIGDVDVTSAVITGGGIADDATTPGNPIMVGGYAVETDGTDPGSVSAEDDVTRVRTDRNRRLLVNTAHPNLWTANDNQSSAQTNTSLKSAPGANLSLYITDVIISNGATAGDVRIVEDPAGTPVIKVPKTYVAITGGAVMHFTTPIRISANKAVGYTSTTVTTHSVMVSGYTAP